MCECRDRLEHQERVCQNSGRCDREGTELVHEAMSKVLQCAISPTINRQSCVEEGTRQLRLTEDQPFMDPMNVMGHKRLLGAQSRMLSELSFLQAGVLFGMFVCLGICILL